MKRTKTSLTFLIISFLSCISCQPLPSTQHEKGLGIWHRHYPRRTPRPPPKEEFQLFHKHFKRPYRYGSAEYWRRFDTFQKNLIHTEQLNKLRLHNESAEYGVTKFSDLTPEEFKAKYLSGFNRGNVTQSSRPNLHATVLKRSALKFHPQLKVFPPKVDWRKKAKVMTPVRDQKECGGCWAFSIVEMVESIFAISSGKLVPLSVQEVLDCSNAYDHALWGCKGGDTCRALDWLNKTKTKLVPSVDYPLQDKGEPCRLKNSSKIGVTVRDYACADFVTREEMLQQYISQIGPISVSVDATTWNNYLGGIIQFHCGENPNNHAVIIVGYDKTGDIPYYIVKNSWGKDFGDKGYMYIAMGGNVCGIALEVSTVAVDNL